MVARSVLPLSSLTLPSWDGCVCMACSYRYNSRLLGSSETAEAADAGVPEAVSAVTESGGYARKRRRYMTSSSSTGLEEQKVSITSAHQQLTRPCRGSNTTILTMAHWPIVCMCRASPCTTAR